MSDYSHTIVHSVVRREPDGKIFVSAHGKQHNGKKCKPLRALTPEDKEHAAHFDKDIGQTVVGLEDGSTAVLLNDECRF